MVIKGEGYERLYVGKLVSDPKVSTFGEKQYTKTRFGVRYKDGESGIIDVDTKFELADRCKELKKFDGVIVVGKLDNWEDKDGKKRWFLDAEIVTTDISTVYRAYKKTNSAPVKEVQTEQTAFGEMTELAGEDLPF